jgi:GNAT superfamily N-acetyltransferase
MIQIRQCNNDDFNDAVALLHQLWPDKPLNRKLLRIVFDHALTSEWQKYLCAVENDRVIGFGSLTIKNNLWQEGYIAHIDELVVDSEYRGKGIGTQLLQQLMIQAKEKGCRRIELDTAFHRKEAHRFYEQQGFENRAYLFSKVL